MDLHGPPGVSRVYYQCVRGEKTEKCLVKHPQQYSDLFLSDYGWETSQTPLGATSDLCEDLHEPNGVSGEGRQGVLGEKTGRYSLHLFEIMSMKEAEQLFVF